MFLSPYFKESRQIYKNNVNMKIRKNEEIHHFDIEGDVILCRLSALLYEHFGSAEDDAIGIECEGCDRCRCLIPDDMAVILPTILPDNEVNLDVTRSPRSVVESFSGNPVRSLLNILDISEVEALNPINGGPTAGQCQFACIASALCNSSRGVTQLCDGYRPDLELRSLALHVIENNPHMYRDYLTVVS